MNSSAEIVIYITLSQLWGINNMPHYYAHFVFVLDCKVYGPWGKSLVVPFGRGAWVVIDMAIKARDMYYITHLSHSGNLATSWLLTMLHFFVKTSK